MIDTHCHLNFQAFNNDVDDVVRRFVKKGGEVLVVVGAKIDSSNKAVQLAKKHSFCFASIGFHPHHIKEINDLSSVEEQLENLVNEKKVVAVGETGIDYYQYKNSPKISSIDKQMQKDLFLLHLEIANRHKLPVIIHCREAQNDLISYLSEFMKNKCITGVFHCFDGSEEYLNEVLSMGFYIGFDGNITYKNNNHLRNLVLKTPVNKLLVETDSPYLTPEPFRGQRNEPSHLVYTISKIAEIKMEKPENIASITSQNARSLFSLS